MSSEAGKVTSFRNWISRDPGAEFPPEAGRYHLYISLACPFASRANFVLHYKGLDKVISTDVVHYWKGEKGWEFTPGHHRTDPDSVNGKKYLREVYVLACPEYEGRTTVPVLFDKKTKKIVNNESGDILRMLNSEFNEFCPTDAQRAINVSPMELRETVDEWAEKLADAVNSGVYRCGLATTQEAYDQHVKKLFDMLDHLEDRLSTNHFILGDCITELDIRLFVSLVRFDISYHVLFKCNKRRIVDYPNLWAYTRELYQLPNVATTVDRLHFEQNYPSSFKQANPHGIVPIGPEVNFEEPHGRDAKFGKATANPNLL